MDKNICLELFEISAGLPPIYTHPYHKIGFPRRKIERMSVAEKIAKLKKVKRIVMNSDDCKIRKKGKFRSVVPRVKIQIVEKTNDKYFRPLTCSTTCPLVYLNLSYPMFSCRSNRDKPQLHLRGGTIT
ncbi:hypothetical protein SteCoe_24241 [Stentor coeruleus]|uniref:Uncharacterized protein n=1 Tax=Stentor coeruleus TaxID=5963 RepID=A0A1R2BI39_9CILI|nr:hypothetical protein SteCoe_24241 [Stentor coeruleus]